MVAIFIIERIAYGVRRVRSPQKYRTLKFWSDLLGGEIALNSRAKSLTNKLVSHICTKYSWYLPDNSLCYILKKEDIDKIANRKSLFFICDKDVVDYPCMVAKNPINAYATLCRFFRDMHESLSITAVIGSIGKTTVKNMIASVYQTQYKSFYAESNINTKTGIGFALQHIPNRSQKMIQEIHEGDPNEVQYMSKMLHPNVAVITTIDRSHFSHFGSEEKIVEEVCSITKHMQQSGIVVVNMDEFDRYDLLNGRKIIKISTTNREADFYADAIAANEEGLCFNVNVKECNNHYQVQLYNIWAIHNVSCALYAFAAGYYEGVTPDNIVKGLANYKTKGQRQNILRTANGVVVYADCYNAVAKSVKSAIDACDTIPVKGNRIAVLGDVEEAGDISESTHQEILEYVNTSKFDILLTKGDKLKKALEYTKVKDSVSVYCCDTNDQLSKKLKGIIQQGDLVLFKSSHSGKLEECIMKVWPELKKEMSYESSTFNKWKTRSLFY